MIFQTDSQISNILSKHNGQLTIYGWGGMAFPSDFKNFFKLPKHTILFKTPKTNDLCQNF